MSIKQNLVTFTTQDVARVLSASRTSVQRWIDSGNLRAFKTPGGHRRVTQGELVSFLRKQGVPIPASLQARPRLLAVDDAAGVRALKTLGRALSGAVDLEAPEDPVAALMSVGAGDFDVLLLDAELAEPDALLLLEKVKAAPRTSSAVVFAVGRRPDAKLEAKFRKAGAAAWLVRPLTAEALLAELREAGLLGDGATAS